jgi:undecaprenyl diphosphate synthase
LHLRQERSNIVDEVTFWGLSRENKKRPQEELDGLYDLLREFKPRLLEIAYQTQTHVFMVGDPSLLPSDIVELMADISEETQ